MRDPSRITVGELFTLLAQDTLHAPAEAELDAPDRRDGRVYRAPRPLQLAVAAALTTGRPLLLRGEPGSGKSSLAPYVARALGYRYYEYTTTAATRAQDLQWRYDTVRRLSDAQVRRPDGQSYRSPTTSSRGCCGGRSIRSRRGDVG